jgi:hypothetical protein
MQENEDQDKKQEQTKDNPSRAGGLNPAPPSDPGPDDPPPPDNGD